jgi:hypothetical protein
MIRSGKYLKKILIPTQSPKSGLSGARISRKDAEVVADSFGIW